MADPSASILEELAKDLLFLCLQWHPQEAAAPSSSDSSSSALSGVEVGGSVPGATGVFAEAAVAPVGLLMGELDMEELAVEVACWSASSICLSWCRLILHVPLMQLGQAAIVLGGDGLALPPVDDKVGGAAEGTFGVELPAADEPVLGVDMDGALGPKYLPWKTTEASAPAKSLKASSSSSSSVSKSQENQLLRDRHRLRGGRYHGSEEAHRRPYSR